MATLITDIPIIDTDTHVVEPPDLWTSRVSSKWGDAVPHVAWDPVAEEEAWFMGSQRLSPVASPAMAGWNEYPPAHPRRWSDADPAAWDPVKRLARMDDYNIRAELLYPNVAVFNAKSLTAVPDEALRLACIQAYNDYLTDFASVAPDRYVPIAILPFWDLDLTIAEIERTKAAGHKGVAFTQEPTFFGLPKLTDRHWDRLWACAQANEMPINFHIASGNLEFFDMGVPENGEHANYAMMGVNFFMSNAKTISQLTVGGICHRFPTLDFVSVESGIGWIPFTLEGLDWQYLNCGVHKEHPEYDLLPSEYFKRQIYGCFWFERDSALHAIDQIGADNVLYETDFPHPTSMSPGPATAALRPDQYLREAFSGLDEVRARKILHDNAARIYHLD